MPIELVAGEVVTVPALEDMQQHELVLLIRHYERLVEKLINEIDVKDRDAQARNPG